MKAKMIFVLMGATIGIAAGEIKHSEAKTGNENPNSALSGGSVKKLAITGRVLQVLDDGLLFSWDRGTYVLMDYPDFKKMADGDAVNCYVVKTEKTYEYMGVDGARHTARVYKFMNQRIGKR